MDRKNLSFTMGNRLKKLREEHVLSHVELAKQLEEKYGISVSRDSLMAYEISDETRAKANKLPNLGMRVEYLYCLADFYGVSLDYLLGKTDISSFDTKTRAVCEYTGLSENSIKNILKISELKKEPDAEVAPCYALNRIIGSEYFGDMIGAAASLVGKGVRDPSPSCEPELCTTLFDIEALLKEKYNLDFCVLFGSDVKDVYKENAVSFFKDILDDMFHEIELKKQKSTEERTLGEICRIPEDDAMKMIKSMIQKR